MRPARFALASILTAGAVAQEWLPLDGFLPFGGNAAYDRARGRAVLVGTAGEVFELDGARVLRRAVDPGLQPGPRTGAALAYDEARGHVLMFGGSSILAPLGDTWIWDGVRWRQPFSIVSPPRRTGAALAYDSARQRVVLHGGSDGSSVLNDTWEHDGSQWLQRLTPNRSPQLMGARMAFDRRRGVSVLVGADLSGQGFLLFEWNGADWLPRTATGPSPPLRQDPGFCYDEVRQRCVLAGGQNATPDVWEWDGTAWRTAGPAPDLDRESPATWFDPARGAVVVAGGIRGVDGAQTDVWSWDGALAVRIRGDHAPPRQLASRAWVWSPRSRSAVLFGGRPGLLTETWEWDGAAWTRQGVGSLPSPRQSAATATDRTNGRALLFGGAGAALFLADLWAWDGTTWTPLPAAQTPPARANAGLAFDESRGVAVLFGGQDLAGNVLDDTWEWSGSWQQRPAGTRPIARYSHAMAFDAARRRTVLFGGTSAQLQPFGDTWEWDGSLWRQIASPSSPPANYEPSMAYDRARGRIAVVEVQGLFGPGNTVYDQGLWDWDGAHWTLVDRRNGSGIMRIVYDERRARIVGYDGEGVREWTVTTAGVGSFGNGCGAPLQFALRTRPRIGDPDFGLEATAAPGSAVLFALAGAAANTPIGGGCTVLVGAPLATALRFANPTGVAVQPIPLPVAPALRGLGMFGQAGSIDPAGALSLSRGLVIHVGD